jgi:hypothetical protein
VELLRDSEKAAAMAQRARTEVETNWDMAAITKKLVDSYAEMVREERRGIA